MKKNLLLFIAVIAFSLGTSMAQTTPASATWALTSATAKTVVTAGQISAPEELLFNTEINGYTGPGSSQRIRKVSNPTNTWPANLTFQIDTVYIQFSITPKDGSVLHVNSVSLDIAASSSSTMEANIYYSTDPTFATSTSIRYVDASSNNYVSSSALQNVSASSLDVVVNPGETFYVRVYPWHEATSQASGKYVCLQNVNISGQTESLPVASAVLWPYDTDESFVSTGPIVGAGPTYGDSLKYYGKTNLNISGTSTSASVGAIQTVSKVWFAATDTLPKFYFQYAASPKSGGTLNVKDVSLYIGGWFSSNLKAALYYSTDPTFASKTELIPGFSLVGSAIELKSVPLDVTVNSGETFYLRVYPYNTASEGWAKLVAVDSVKISGTVTGVTADPPTLTTTSVTDISTTYAASGGNITTDGGSPVTERGICWNTSGTPTIADSKTSDGTSSGSFKSVAKNLTPGTTYYLRAYATNSAGTSYGSEQSFATLSAVVAPTVTTTAASTILVKSALSGGSIAAWGGDTIKHKGICWNTTGSPTLIDSKTDEGTGNATYSSTIYPLTENTTYYVRAYATNSAGTSYGNEITLTTLTPQPDVTKVVAKDGSGDYTTVQAAFNDVPDNYTGKWTIFVKPGTYKEKLLLGSTKINITLKGVHPDSTILTYDDNANTSNGSGGTLGTSGSYSVSIDADDFTAMDITFQNTNKDAQAVALEVNADRQSYYRCKLLGYQDTYYTRGSKKISRTYMKDCYIEGSVDFIFGRNIVVFDSCEIHENRNGGTLTAASTEASSKFGYVFLHSKITADETGFDGNAITSFSLGRPWQASPRTVFIDCEEPATLASAGWLTWNVTPGLYAEYKCFGPGSETSGRLTSISKQLTDNEATGYTLNNIFAKSSDPSFGYDWMPDETIGKLPQTITFDLPGKTYGDAMFKLGATSSANLPVSYTIEDESVAKLSNDTVTILKVGNTQITASANSNFMYTGTSPVVQTLTVNKATLTVTADNKNKTAGEANPEFTASYSGFVGTDNIDSIDVKPTISCSATVESAAGTYDIIITGGSDNNYQFNNVNGVLTVSPATGISIASGDVVKVYPNPASYQIHIQRNSATTSTLVILNTNGSKMLEKVLENDAESIDVSSWPKGIYIIKLDNKTVKISVQ